MKNHIFIYIVFQLSKSNGKDPSDSPTTMRMDGEWMKHWQNKPDVLQHIQIKIPSLLCISIEHGNNDRRLFSIVGRRFSLSLSLSLYLFKFYLIQHRCCAEWDDTWLKATFDCYFQAMNTVTSVWPRRERGTRISTFCYSSAIHEYAEKNSGTAIRRINYAN